VIGEVGALTQICWSRDTSRVYAGIRIDMVCRVIALVLLLALSTSGLGLGGLRGRHEWLGAHVKNRRQQKVAASSKVEKEPGGVTEGETLRALSTEQEGWGQNLPKPTYSTHKCTGQVSAPSVASADSVLDPYIA
jgi:hypothetical protein